MGQTGRSFRTRFNEHRKEIDNPPFKTAFSEHLSESHHTCEFNKDFEILHLENKSRKLNLLESIEIKKCVNADLDILNTCTNFAFSPLVNYVSQFK